LYPRGAALSNLHVSSTFLQSLHLPRPTTAQTLLANSTVMITFTSDAMKAIHGTRRFTILITKVLTFNLTNLLQILATHLHKARADTCCIIVEPQICSHVRFEIITVVGTNLVCESEGYHSSVESTVPISNLKRRRQQASCSEKLISFYPITLRSIPEDSNFQS
jgi:hypothetical protein